MRSFGKRRRRRDAEGRVRLGHLGERLVFDPNLGQEVIELDTPLRKQIFVDPGIKVNRFTDPLGSGAAGVGSGRSGQGRSFSAGGSGGGKGHIRKHKFTFGPDFDVFLCVQYLSRGTLKRGTWCARLGLGCGSELPASYSSYSQS